MTKDEALRLALKGLEIIKASCREGRTAHAENEAAIVQHIIKQALEHPEPEDYPTYDGYIKKALEQLNPPCKTGSQCTSKCEECAEPEPVADVRLYEYSGVAKNGVFFEAVLREGATVSDGDKLYTYPPKRKWQGLTQQEQASVLASVPTVPFEGDWHLVLLTAIEAKLKEKNI